MSWGVDEIELDSLPLHTYWSELDSDTTLTLEIHLVECLRLELTLIECSSDLHESIGKSRLPMVDMGDDTEIADGRGFSHALNHSQKDEKGKKE